MGKYKIELVTTRDCQEFIHNLTRAQKKADLIDGKGYRVSANSMLGALAALEWDSLFVVSEDDIYEEVKKWVV